MVHTKMVQYTLNLPTYTYQSGTTLLRHVWAILSPPCFRSQPSDQYYKHCFSISQELSCPTCNIHIEDTHLSCAQLTKVERQYNHQLWPTILPNDWKLRYILVYLTTQGTATMGIPLHTGSWPHLLSRTTGHKAW